ncbi:MAG: carboxylating nicotinate-nucleotide diphosphorylase [Gemmatimonadetes bacterium]|nr:carboxylating nicotinate-nucleotide diphosphorylase [Gemmatimonadota bacterium]
MTFPDHSALLRARSALIQLALEEDLGEGDWTTQWTIPEAHRSRAVIVAKAPLVVAGTDCVRDVFRAVDPDLAVEIVVPEGARVDPGTLLAGLRGRTRSLLVGERTALNFLGHLSGIATLTRRFVEAVAGTGARILDTRKTTPGWRLLEKAAVRAGGGLNHRVGLHDMVLVKDNHADACGGVANAARAAMDANDQGLAVEVEVRTVEELEEVLPLRPQRILLDNMTPETLRACVARVRREGPQRPEGEASGNVTLANVRAVAETGVDYISIGALTHSAPCADVSMRVMR